MRIPHTVLWGLALAAAFAGAIWAGSWKPLDPSERGRRLPASGQLRGVSLAVHDEAGEPIVRLRSDAVARDRVRLGPVSLHRFFASEVVLQRCRLTITRAGAGAGRGGDGPSLSERVADVLRQVAFQVGAAGVSRIRLEELELDAVSGGVERFQVFADRAHIPVDAPHVELKRFSVRAASGQRLDARSGRWLLDDWRLEVRGSWRLVQGGAATTGSRGGFALDAEGRIRPLIRPAKPEPRAADGADAARAGEAA